MAFAYLGKTKVNEGHVAVVIDHQVSRLDVAVHDSSLVQGLDATEHVVENGYHVLLTYDIIIRYRVKKRLHILADVLNHHKYRIKI